MLVFPYTPFLIGEVIGLNTRLGWCLLDSMYVYGDPTIWRSNTTIACLLRSSFLLPAYRFAYCPLRNTTLKALCFAFGQTGAGKTYSMVGEEGGRSPLSQGGIIPQAASELFRKIAKLEAGQVQQPDGNPVHLEGGAAIADDGERGHPREGRPIVDADSDADRPREGGGSAVYSTTSTKYQVRVQFLEVYCGLVYDLLDTRKSCKLRTAHDPGLRVYAEGATETRVTSVEQLSALVALGTTHRSTAATGVRCAVFD
jgi:hypothetical protein